MASKSLDFLSWEGSCRSKSIPCLRQFFFFIHGWRFSPGRRKTLVAWHLLDLISSDLAKSGLLRELPLLQIRRKRLLNHYGAHQIIIITIIVTSFNGTWKHNQHSQNQNYQTCIQRSDQWKSNSSNFRSHFLFCFVSLSNTTKTNKLNHSHFIIKSFYFTATTFT